MAFGLNVEMKKGIMQDENINSEPYNQQGERHGLWVLYWSDNSFLSKTNYVNGERFGFREEKARHSLKIRKLYYAR